MVIRFKGAFRLTQTSKNIHRFKTLVRQSLVLSSPDSAEKSCFFEMEYEHVECNFCGICIEKMMIVAGKQEIEEVTIPVAQKSL